MLRKFRERAQDEKGFTLIELLVVILIIGILAAIAIPSFINQRNKGQDAKAKSNAVTALQSEETYYTDNNAYTAVISDIQAIESSLKNAPVPVVTRSTATTIGIDVTSTDGRVFKIDKAADGTVTRACTVPSGVDRGGCPSGGTW
jgi:type IV pilus assembly protein PilA